MQKIYNNVILHNVFALYFLQVLRSTNEELFITIPQVKWGCLGLPLETLRLLRVVILWYKTYIFVLGPRWLRVPEIFAPPALIVAGLAGTGRSSVGSIQRVRVGRRGTGLGIPLRSPRLPSPRPAAARPTHRLCFVIIIRRQRCRMELWGAVQTS